MPISARGKAIPDGRGCAGVVGGMSTVSQVVVRPAAMTLTHLTTMHCEKNLCLNVNLKLLVGFFFVLFF